jgi:hypothetical protein
MSNGQHREPTLQIATVPEIAIAEDSKASRRNNDVWASRQGLNARLMRHTLLL